MITKEGRDYLMVDFQTNQDVGQRTTVSIRQPRGKLGMLPTYTPSYVPLLKCGEVLEVVHTNVENRLPVGTLLTITEYNSLKDIEDKGEEAVNEHGAVYSTEFDYQNFYEAQYGERYVWVGLPGFPYDSTAIMLLPIYRDNEAIALCKLTTNTE